MAWVAFARYLAREHRWHGWRRFAALAMGRYPVVFRFPLAATSAPPELASPSGHCRS